MIEAAIVFSIAAFVGNFGVALTGFGMAIFFLFVYVSEWMNEWISQSSNAAN